MNNWHTASLSAAIIGFLLTRPQLGNSGLFEKVEFPNSKYEIMSKYDGAVYVHPSRKYDISDLKAACAIHVTLRYGNVRVLGRMNR